MGEVTRVLIFVRGHRSCNGLVQAAIECVKLLGADSEVRLTRQLRHDLTDVSVSVHDLRNRQAVPQQVLTVVRGRVGNFRRAGQRADWAQRACRGDRGERIHDLGQKYRDSMLEFSVRRLRSPPFADALPSAVDDFLSVRNDELLKHLQSTLRRARRFATSVD
jgi:hypothetical protein